MKKFYLLIILFVVIANDLKAQETPTPAFEITVDTATHQVIPDKYWQLLEDPAGTLTINQIASAQYASKFHGNTTRTKGYNYDIDTYWVRYRLKNTLNHPVKVTIPEHVAYAWLYIQKPNNQWQVQTNGQFVPWSKRDGLKLIHQFLVTVNSGEELILYEKDVIDFHAYKPKVFELSIGFIDAVVKASYIDNISDYQKTEIYSMTFGFLLLAAVINFLFYRIVGEKVFLFFALFMLSHGLFDFTSRTHVSFLKQHPYLIYYLSCISLIALFYTMMHFIRHFLHTMVYTPKWDKFLIILSLVSIVTWIWVMFGQATLNYKNFLISQIVSTVIIYTYYPFALVTLIYFIPRQKGAERLGIIAILPAFAWLAIGYGIIDVTRMLHDNYNIPFSAFYLWLQERRDVIELVCFLWLVIGFAGILFKRFQVMQQGLIQADLDKERIAKEKEIERSQFIEKQNAELEQQVERRTSELKRSLDDLKTTQQQLIQSEKLASLGELTAGIAHEIQNPLNFVNNFSEVSIELVEEMELELSSGDKNEAISIAGDIKQNLEKIIHHGKRADSIVKGMLQHSRASSNTKEPNDINKLADEYLRLAFHGLRVKDKSFNAELITHYAENLPAITIVPQDIGRVMLNLFNNAFYAVQKKENITPAGFTPTVELSTAMKDGFVTITVKDNGTGIPDDIKDKIMQPFFTTKPTGEGTGLGLSLSYDIVVKAHGGSINLNSKEGEGSEFIVKLPTV